MLKGDFNDTCSVKQKIDISLQFILSKSNINKFKMNFISWGIVG